MRWKRWLLVGAVGLATVSAGALASPSPDTFHVSRDVRATTQAPGGWDEPSGIATMDDPFSGHRHGGDGYFVASQNPNTTGAPDMTLSSSADGLNWHEDKAYYSYLSGRPEGQTGDVTMAADRAGTIFLGHLTADLQASIDWSRDRGKTWHTANDIGRFPGPEDASSSPGLVDRPWIAAYSPDGNYRHTRVYLEYHDFVASAVEVVTCSMTTGSLACSPPTIVSNPQTVCNSIPGGMAVSPPGSKHPGRVFAVWSTADPITNLTQGCNYTQLQPFYAIYTAWSDHPGDASSWHKVPVYIGPTGNGQNCAHPLPVARDSHSAGLPGAINSCADVSELFTPIAIDRAGNAYVSFVDYISTLHKHYDVYVARSLDGGNRWDGRADGHGTPLLVSNNGGTHFVPNLVAGSDGRVAVVYYTTSYSDRPFFTGDSCPSGVPPEQPCQGKARPEPPSAAWVVDVSLSLNASSSNPRFTQHQVSDPGVVVHYGDICNLGIYCDGSSTGNRSVFENNSVFPDENGYLIAAWGDQRLDPHLRQDAASSHAQALQVAYDQIYVACQSSGPSLYAGRAPIDRTEQPGRSRCGI